MPPSSCTRLLLCHRRLIALKGRGGGIGVTSLSIIVEVKPDSLPAHGACYALPDEAPLRENGRRRIYSREYTLHAKRLIHLSLKRGLFSDYIYKSTI
ncbi:MAG: hypothetical protein BAJALOKI1v1_860008 [Promethearchaeota archaeon]|nr:MAG: hypothetical protein BAJALOKI1v1_860008 [Candidatus Lokiarchaeota archaeon]